MTPPQGGDFRGGDTCSSMMATASTTTAKKHSLGWLWIWDKNITNGSMVAISVFGFAISSHIVHIVQTIDRYPVTRNQA
jgi:hypothetical protein